MTASRQDGTFAFCAKYQPDLVGDSQDAKQSRTCGIATVNPAHVASYKECYPPVGQTCKEHKGGWLGGWLGGSSEVGGCAGGGGWTPET